MCSPRTIHLSQLASCCHQGFQLLLSYWNDIPMWQVLSLFSPCLLSTLFLEGGWTKTKLEIAVSTHQLLQRYQSPYMIVLAGVLTHTYAHLCTNSNSVHLFASLLFIFKFRFNNHLCIYMYIWLYIYSQTYTIFYKAYKFPLLKFCC